MNSIDLFVKNWGSKGAMVPINLDDISELELQLGVKLPKTYKYLISTYGLVHTPNVLTKIIDLNVNLSEVQDFLNLDDVASLSTLYEMSGMPKGHILFASDCKGNMFCFHKDDCNTSADDTPVYFFDYALSQVKKVSPSFTAWLAAFNAL